MWLPLHAAPMTLVTRELFQGIGTLDSGSTGNLGTVSGEFVKRPVGPRAIGAARPGWSAEIRSQNTSHIFDLQTSGSAAQATGMFGAWFFISSINTDPVNQVRLIRLASIGDNPVADVTIDAGYKVSLALYNATSQNDVATLQPNTWYWIAVQWRQHDDGGPVSCDAAFYLQRAGHPTVRLGTPVSGIGMSGDFGDIEAGAENTGGFAAMTARYGAPSLYKLNTYPAPGYPPDLSAPTPARHTWYVNPATGDDNNTGLSASQAWRTVGKINDEAQNLGILAASHGTEHGDIILLDTLRAPLVLGTNSLLIPTDGVTLRPAPGQRYAMIQAEKTIDPTTWTKTNGYTFIYQTADTGTDVVMWDNDRWLYHPTGNSLSDVGATLDSTPGSFWTDGQTLYYHSLDGSDPATNGDTCTRSEFRGTDGDSAVELAGNSWTVTGLRVRKTCLADPSMNDPVEAYCFQQVGSTVSGTCRISNCYFDYGSKHLMGFTADSTDTTLVATNVTCEQGSPYAGSGGQSPFVSFMQNGSGNTHIYKNCTTIHNAGAFGAATGTTAAIYPAFITHGPGDAYKSLQFLGCHLAPGPFNDQGTVIDRGLVIKNSQLFKAEFSSPDVRISGCTVTNGLAFTNGGAITGSRIVSTVDYTANGPEALSGTVSMTDCKVDLSQNPTPNGGRFSPWFGAGKLVWTFAHNSFLVPAASDLTICNSLDDADDTLKFSSNSYKLGSEGWFIGSYSANSQPANPLTFQQWLKLGFDHGSTVTIPK